MVDKNRHTKNINNLDDKASEKTTDTLVDESRRDFILGSALAVGCAISMRTELFTSSAHAYSLGDIVSATEKDVFYRDRLPDYQTPFSNDVVNDKVSLFDWDFPNLVTSALGDGSFGTQGMPANFSTFTTVPSAYQKMPIAIIGAGAAGLAAGYELMKLGFEIHYYEMQTQDDANGQTYARPNGRAYSWDYGGNGRTVGAGAGWYPTAPLTEDTIKPQWDVNVHSYGRRVVDMGAMRFPATHLTLRTYTDEIFFGNYYYGDNQPLNTPWVPFRDPGLYRSQNKPMPGRGGVVMPSDNDQLIYDTVYHTKGIFGDRGSPEPPTPGGYSEFDRVTSGTTLAASNAAVRNLTNRYFDLLYGETSGSNPYQGVLTPILELYSSYTNAPSQEAADAISNEWRSLLKRFDKMSLGEVLSAAGWNEDPAYAGQWGDLGISLSEMFGEIGTGTGPFAMFYYSSFMELLRIALQAADSNQDYFLGGASYQLQPFLIHMTRTSQSTTPTCLWNETQNKVVTDKVVSVTKTPSGGVRITTENASGTPDFVDYTAAIVTASPSAMRAADIFPEPDGFLPARTVSYIKRIRINNNSKIAINFPNIEGEKNSAAFWMKRTDAKDTNPNNDQIVTTLTDKTIRQIYTFDNYHWGTMYRDTEIGGFDQQGSLMLNYGWDYNAQSWTASDLQSAVRSAWKQMTDIYNFGTQYDDYLEWALANDQAYLIVWERIDGFNAAWRMAQPLRATQYGPSSGTGYQVNSELQSAQIFGMTSYNPHTKEHTGLFLAGEAVASPGLSGWIEGSIQTGLQAVAGIIRYLNIAKPDAKTPAAPQGAKSFALQAHPGLFGLQKN